MCEAYRLRGMHSEFVMRNCRVRYHPNNAIATLVDGNGTELVGLLRLHNGFVEGAAIVEGCHFVKDESVPPGKLVIEPV
jgi:hypothetical protein